MARWYRWSLMPLILLVVWGCAKSSSLEGQGKPMAEVKPLQIRFTKANNGVITDSVTGLDWYVETVAKEFSPRLSIFQVKTGVMGP